ncbi:MAG: bifunctional glutamate N-acetyltransferase/amino-acid acetyltransferase ArgJ [Oscillospiraceae bacterium]|nr:bifunctional glutamate N-acetyltransferase/amino-acid acetyltransferase ArgJ [Oscillospiraceae bacterium]
MKYIDGGVCAAKGFKAAGVFCGVKANSSPSKKDLALIYSEIPCAAAGIFTKNQVKAAPVLLDMELIKDGVAQAIVANSKNANACAPDGMENAKRMCQAAANALNIPAENVMVSSTGVIGQRLNIEAIEKGIPMAVEQLSYDGSDAAANAIMTTDTVKKEFACELEIGGKLIHIGGIAKGSGMIHPNMGTMLCYITTDCAISAAMLKKALLDANKLSFNRISVDGDTSTNDSCIVLANGLAGNAEITAEGTDYDAFFEAFLAICTALARSMAADGEGAKHLITCVVKGAASVNQAETIGKSVIGSALTKSAIFGCDANWGRVLAAMGYSGETFDPEKVNVSFASTAGSILVCKDGRGVDFDEELATKILSESEVIIDILMAEGSCEATCWGCDLTYDYVRINGDYRT